MKKIVTIVALVALHAISYAQTKVNVDFSYKLSNFSYCSFYEFYIDKNTDKLEKDLAFLKKRYEESRFFDNEASRVKILSSIHFDWSKQKQTVVYCKEVKDSLENYRFFYTDTSYIAVLKSVQNILTLTNDAFWAFYNSENNPKYPEINALKPRVKDADGVLNIFKLAKVVEENRGLLSKYIEE